MSNTKKVRLNYNSDYHMILVKVHGEQEALRILKRIGHSPYNFGRLPSKQISKYAKAHLQPQ